MENKRLIVIFATCFSVFFSILYYFLFTLNPDDSKLEKRTLYMNQVGLYEKRESIQSMMEKLKKEGFASYELKQDNLTAVVCSVSTNQKDSQQEQQKLKELNYSYIAKSVTVEDREIVSFIDQQQYEKALERIGK